jgi:hypothetical protein
LMASNAWGFSERVHLAFRRTWVQMGNNAFNKTARLNLWMGALPFIVWRIGGRNLRDGNLPIRM